MRKFTVAAAAGVVAAAVVAPAAHAAPAPSPAAPASGVQAAAAKHHWNLNKDSRNKPIAPTNIKISGYWQVVGTGRIKLVFDSRGSRPPRGGVTYYFGSPTGKLGKRKFLFSHLKPSTSLGLTGRLASAQIWADKFYYKNGKLVRSKKYLVKRNY
ncbi:hypothetical protein ACSNOI_30775 [Actinomadura kijaniata]|uniref:hypothetical protein n=1 Tax=Actinomadura kijaniata TaxID=46161 RepID=UPI003F1B1A18